MKISTILSLLGLLSTSIAAPSHSEERDVNIVLHGPASDHVETTMGGPLSSGVYFISSPALEERGFVLGRGIREDRSLLPKPIKTVSRGDAGQIFWRVDRLDGRRYRLGLTHSPNAEPTPVANIDDGLFAILDRRPPVDWIIEYQEQHRAYTIVSANQNYLGWFASPKNDEQVSLRPLIVMPSWPPQYPKTQLFTFRPVGPAFNEAMASTTKAGINIEVTVEDL